jgi:glycosyltransferase involved in cell wall biosynthesis
MGELVLLGRLDHLVASGGGESYVHAQALAAQLAGYRTTLVTASKRGGTVVGDFGTIVRVRTPIRPVRTTAAPFHSPWLSREIVRLLDGRPGPHVLHGYGGWAGAALAATRELRRRGVETTPIATAFTTLAHEVEAKRLSPVLRAGLRTRSAADIDALWVRTLGSRYERRVFRACSAVVVNYESVRRLLEDAYGAGTMQIRRLTYASPICFRPAKDLASSTEPGALQALADPEAPLVLSISRHDGRKGLDVFLRALASLRDEGIRFRACLVGPGILLEQHRRLATELGLADRVAIPGRVPDVAPYLGRADVFALPSLEEGSGSIAVLEALGAGVPVVATDVDGMPEDLTDGEDSLLVPPSDSPALAAALRRLLEDRELRGRLGAGARKLHERRFTAEAFSSDLARLYSDHGLHPTAS